MKQPKTQARGNATGVPVASMNTIGDTGLKQYGGIVVEEFLPALKGQKGIQVYREMADNDATAGAVLFAITTLIRQCEWTVQAADDSPEGEAGKEFVEQMLDDMAAPLSSVIAEACSMFPYGFAPMEITWKRRTGEGPDPRSSSKYDDGKIGIRNLALRAQTTVSGWVFDPEDGTPIAMKQQPISGGTITIPMEKMLLFRTTTERNNPEGRSILRNAYRPYHFKKKIEEIEAIGIERDMAGLPVARIPAMFFDPSASPADKGVLREWQRLVTTIRRDQREGIVLPSARDAGGNLLYELELLSSSSTRAIDTTKVVDRYDRAIATSVLADFIFLGQQAVGSFALSSDKTALFAAAVGAFTKAMQDVFNRDLLPRAWRYNGLNPEFMPLMQCGDVESQNLAELAAYISALTGAGAQLFPDRELENHLRAAGGLPQAPEDGSDDDGALDAEIRAEMERQRAAREAVAAGGEPIDGKDGAE